MVYLKTSITFFLSFKGCLYETVIRRKSVKKAKKTVDFPCQASYKGLASEDVPLARIKVCILRKSTRVSPKVPGFMSGTFFMDPS